MKQKYIFLDIDGTLFNNRGELPQTSVLAMKEARRMGHKLFLCTGRAKGEIPQMLWDQEFHGIICSAGAYVEADGRILKDEPFTKRQMETLISYMEEHRLGYIYETIRGITGKEECCKMYRNNLEIFRTINPDLVEDFMGPITIEDSWSESTKAYKVHFYTHLEEDVKRFIEDVGDSFTILPCTIPMLENVIDVEVSAPGMSKAEGITTIMDYYGGSIEDTVAFGDGSNDYEMLSLAGIGVAMGNGPDSLKETADMVTASVNDEGLYKGFIMAGLIPEKGE